MFGLRGVLAAIALRSLHSQEPQSGGGGCSLEVLQPQNGSLVVCAKGQARATTSLVTHLYVDAQFAELDFQQLRMHVTVNPDTPAAALLGSVPAGDITRADMFLDRLLPGNRTVRAVLRDASGVELCSTGVHFSVLCNVPDTDTDTEAETGVGVTGTGAGTDGSADTAVAGLGGVGGGVGGGVADAYHRTVEDGQLVDFSVLSSRSYDPSTFDRAAYFDQIFQHDFWGRKAQGKRGMVKGQGQGQGQGQEQEQEQVQEQTQTQTHTQEQGQRQGMGQGQRGMGGGEEWSEYWEAPSSGPGSTPYAARGAMRAVADALGDLGPDGMGEMGIGLGGMGAGTGVGVGMEGMGCVGCVGCVRVTRLIDVPCGDMSWLDLGLLQRRNVSYVGVDVSHRVIRQNIRNFGAGAGAGTGTRTGTGDKRNGGTGEDGGTGAPPITPPTPPTPTVHFLQGDVTQGLAGIAGLGGLGRLGGDIGGLGGILGEGDLILCRHLMLHLPPQDNLAVLAHLAASGARYALLTTYLRADENRKDFVFGMGHLVNLLRSPYCLPDPLRLYGDYTGDMYLGLWDLQKIRDRGANPVCMT